MEGNETEKIKKRLHGYEKEVRKAKNGGGR